jgi:hypothetical protein
MAPALTALPLAVLPDARDAGAMLAEAAATAISMNVSFLLMLANPLSYIPNFGTEQK